MRTKPNIAVFALLLLAASSQCFAMMSVARVSRERAKALGMEIRWKAAGPNAVWVELKFRQEGELKDFAPERFSRVELRITDGDKPLVTAALQMKRPSPKQVIVSFTAARAHLDRIALMVVVGSGLMPGGAFELQVSDFVELGKPD